MAGLTVDGVWDSRPCQWGRDRLPLVQRGVDASVWLLAVPVSAFLRYDGHFAPMQHSWVALFAVLGATAQLLAGQVLGLYRRRWRYGSFDELMAVAVSSVAASFLLYAVRALLPADGLPRTVPILAGILAL